MCDASCQTKPSRKCPWEAMSPVRYTQDRGSELKGLLQLLWQSVAAPPLRWKGLHVRTMAQVKSYQTFRVFLMSRTIEKLCAVPWFAWFGIEPIRNECRHEKRLIGRTPLSNNLSAKRLANARLRISKLQSCDSSHCRVQGQRI